MESQFSFNPNPLVRYLQKPAEFFTREDMIRFVEGNQIQQMNFRYVAGDGRLKTLNFIITGREHLEDILTFGERVDGSSLFPFMETGSSDLYVIPRYRTAFINPFSEQPSLEILCSFFDFEGKPLELSPEYVLQKAISHFRKTTGLNMIEIPRAALTADHIAVEADFFSFGTNDLTQMTLGYSRDDAGKFLPEYINKGIFKQDPFQVLDQNGVGLLVEIGVTRGRQTKPNLKVGICGEHGGEPSSVEFCDKVGMNYVSCSPYRVPIARLAAAQANIKHSK